MSAGMVHGAAIYGYCLYLMLDKPICSLGIKAGEMIEEDITLLWEILVPSGIKHDEVTLLDLGLGIIQVFLADDIPLLQMSHVNDNALAIAIGQGNLINTRAVFEYMQGGIHVGGSMELSFDNGGHLIDTTSGGVAREAVSLRE